MSRGKVRTAGDQCADCGATEPSWASINRGVLICDECCSVHRSLGRHISQQLHSSVRTNNLETVLRLISKGADPNYYHPEKGNCPLHVAAGSGQILQIELLVIYGADPGAQDAFGKTPIEYAKAEGHEDIANRLVECQYELTDRLTYYLYHHKGLHFIIPEMADSSLDMSELAKQAKKKLTQLSNHLFEELAMDVYDEVDRRENDSVWLSTHDHTSIVSDRQAVPFLPVNPEFSATRNQGRQKLARFNAREFATLIIDILSDAKRRQTGIAQPLTAKEKIEKRESLPATPTSFKRIANSFASDDEPLYDSVASDEDYSSVDNLSQSSPDPGGSKSEVNEVAGMRQALVHSQSEVRQLIQANKNLQHEVHSLVHENAMLREQQQHLLRGQGPPIPNGGVEGEDTLGRIPGIQTRANRNSGGARPQSMFEPRNQERLSQKSNKSQSKDDLYPVQSGNEYRQIEENKSSSSGSSFSQGSGELRHDSLGHYDNPMSHYDNPRSLPIEQSAIREQCEYEGGPLEDMEGLEGYPSLELLMQKTEKITKKIQTLLLSAQERNITSYGPCANNIHAAVLEMVEVFPEKPDEESVKCALGQLVTSAVRLQEECSECSDISMETEELTFDPSIKTQQVIQCAYDIAKSAKQLVTLFQ
ncbi:GIT2-like protein [Mya arenaria]|uniref:GIT2-like protein n=1 Tax=Mya arenaria TaxID=6604 RepID=A0ABY7E4U7_MYAAR|nr:GIT2-like protein [Mya arenaria]